jgi:hypothetical protein
MACKANAEAAMSPPMNPPPGSLWPRSKTKIEKSSKSGNKKREAVERISELNVQSFPGRSFSSA